MYSCCGRGWLILIPTLKIKLMLLARYWHIGHRGWRILFPDDDQVILFPHEDNCIQGIFHMPPWPNFPPWPCLDSQLPSNTELSLLCHNDESGRTLRLRTPTLKGETESITSHISHHPRSYCFSGAARYDWQHSVPEGSQRRWSFTFRSLKQPSIAPAKSKSVTC